MNLIPILTFTVPWILIHLITWFLQFAKDIFFSPTVTGTLDLVFIESQAAGVAVVGPRAVAVPLVVTDGVNGRRGGKVGKGESEGVEVRQNCFILVQNLKFHFGRMSHCC